MSDAEMLDLVERNRWSIFPQEGTPIPPSWAVESEEWIVFGTTVREAICNALTQLNKQST
jgi:hypothetical protein